MQFESKEVTINAIKQFHIRNHVDYIVVESRPYRYVGQCKYFARCVGDRKINGTHTCVSTCISQDHTKLNSSFIANCIIHLISEDPGITIKALVKEVVTRFGYTVTYRKAWTAKQIAMLQIYVIDVYFQLHLSLSKEKLKKHESGFSTMFVRMLPHNRIYVCWVHSVLSFLNGVMHNQYTVFVILQAISIRSHGPRARLRSKGANF
ncbi:hypothetical protein Lal_00044730 [Lupinus albus]|nr:hypothetical protein Lal_00044730 [Lupinus albus]